MSKYILLTFDLEEFDLPLEFNADIDFNAQLQVTTNGLNNLLAVLKEHHVKATFFTTACYAENNEAVLHELIRDGHEIASHLYYHSVYKEEHLLQSKLKLEQICGQPVKGIRIPRFKQFEAQLIKDAGYTYDSSMHPTIVPGRYNHLQKPRLLWKDGRNGLWIFPLSVLPFFRIPLFWLSFKNIPAVIYFLLCKLALQKDRYLHLYFHPWEFTDLSLYRIPWYIKRRSGTEMTKRLNSFICKMKNKAEFLTITDFISRTT